MYALMSYREMYAPQPDERALVELFDSADDAAAAAETYNPDYDSGYGCVFLRNGQAAATKGVAVELEPFDAFDIDSMTDSERDTAVQIAADRETEIDEEIIVDALEAHERYMLMDPDDSCQAWIATEI